VAYKVKKAESLFVSLILEKTVKFSFEIFDIIATTKMQPVDYSMRQQF